MQNSPYHTFKKTKKLKSGKVKRWYYYYLDGSGKQVQKSCGRDVKTRKQAEDYIRTLPPPPEPSPVPVWIPMASFLDYYKPDMPNKQEAVPALYTLPPKNPDMTVEEIARDMFTPGSAHLRRRQQLKKSVSEESITANRVFMEYIIATWGSRPLRALEMDEIMCYLFAVERSSSWKNQYIAALNEIYLEAQFRGCKVFKPNFPSIGKIENKADIFTSEELERFFKKENFKHDFFFLFFLCSLSGGLRLGETRGLMARQVIFEKKALIVDGFLKAKGKRTTYNKKGSPEHPKLRVVPYPDFTLNLLQEHITYNNIAPMDFIFTYNGHPLGKTMIEAAFNNALINAGIAYDRDTLKEKGFFTGRQLRAPARKLIPDGRRLIFHSFRYTYITRMRREMDALTLSKLTGHESTAQVDYYNRKNLEMALAAIPTADAATSVLLPVSIQKAIV